MSATAIPSAGLTSLLCVGAEQGAQALAGLVGGTARAGAIFAPEPERVAKSSLAISFEVGGALAGTIAVLCAAPHRDRLLGALGSVAQADPRSALSEVANIVASQAVSAIADRLGSRVTLSVPRLVEPGGGPALARAIRGGASALTAEIGAGSAGIRMLLLFLPGAHPASAIP